MAYCLMQMSVLEWRLAKNGLRALLGIKRLRCSWGCDRAWGFSLTVHLCVCVLQRVWQLTATIPRLRKMMWREQPCLPLGQGSCFVLWQLVVREASIPSSPHGQTSPLGTTESFGCSQFTHSGFLFVFKEKKNRTLVIICKGLECHYRAAQVK